VVCPGKELRAGSVDNGNDEQRRSSSARYNRIVWAYRRIHLEQPSSRTRTEPPDNCAGPYNWGFMDTRTVNLPLEHATLNALVGLGGFLVISGIAAAMTSLLICGTAVAVMIQLVLTFPKLFRREADSN
jgi:hypothetical protein